jgi:uncharacterized membrane protein
VNKKFFIFLLLFSIILVLFSFVRDGAIWFDEGYSVFESARTFSKADAAGFTIISPVDVHPPLYYIALHGWRLLFGSAEVVMRLMSVMFMIGSMVVFYYLIKELYPKNWEFTYSIFAVLVFLSTTMIHYATEIRMYSMGLFFCLLSFYFLMTLDKSKWRVIGFVLATALLPYIHYYTVFFVLGELLYSYLFLSYNLPWVMHKNMESKTNDKLLWVTSFLLMIPAVIYFYLQRQRIEGMWLLGSSWLSLPSTWYYSFFHSFGSSISDMNTYLGFVFLLFVFLFILMYFRKLENGIEKKMSFFLLFWFLSVSFLGMVINIFVMKVYHHRLFFFEAWILLLLLSRSIVYLKLYDKKRVAVIALNFAMIAILIFGLFQIYQYTNTIPRELAIVSERMNGLGQHNVVLHESPFSSLAAMYYAPNQEHFVFTDLTDKELASAGGDAIRKDHLIRDMSQMDVPVYYYYEHDGNLRKTGYNCSIILEADGLSLTRCQNRKG